MVKTLNDAYLFRKYPEYEKKLFEAIMKGEEIDKKSENFEGIIFDVKQRQISNSLLKILMSDKIILIVPEKSLPKALKVFAAKDVRGDHKLKVFIDCSGVIYKNEKTGRYTSDSIDILIAYLVNAMTTYIYNIEHKRLTMNTSVTYDGADAFARLVNFVLNHIYRLNNTPSMKAKCTYLSAMYYQVGILGREDGDSVQANAKRLSGISDREEDIIKYQLTESSFLNIKYFVESLTDILKYNKLTLDLFMETWMYLYGTGTVFAVELFPSFSAMLTDTYVGCYINNQKTIQKITDKSMVTYTKNILKIGGESV